MQFWKKRSIIITSISLLLLSACGNKEDVHTAASDQATIDSLVAQRLEEINLKAMEDLDYRLSIEVKQKADSIVAHRTGGQLKAE